MSAEAVLICAGVLAVVVFAIGYTSARKARTGMGGGSKRTDR